LDSIEVLEVQGSVIAKVLTTFISGDIAIWDYYANAFSHVIKVSDKPTRAARWISRKSWIVSGSDDHYLRVFNYGTMSSPIEKMLEWEAHDDYIRAIAVHPSLPLILSASDDRTIKSWDLENEFSHVKTFEGHSHYVMMVKINPTDPNSFASASLDGTIKTWSVTTGEVQVTLSGHNKGVNCIDYCTLDNQPRILSGADDFMIKLWNFHTGECLITLEGHTGNISSVIWHSKHPSFVFSTSEDSTTRMWSLESPASNYRYLTNPDLGRGWALAMTKSEPELLVIGYDYGIAACNVPQNLTDDHEVTSDRGILDTIFVAPAASGSEGDTSLSIVTQMLGNDYVNSVIKAEVQIN